MAGCGDNLGAEDSFMRLLTVHSQFDDDSSDDEQDEESHSSISADHMALVEKVNSISRSSILSLSLISYLCECIEENHFKRKSLFEAVCTNLCQQDYLDVNVSSLFTVVLNQPQFGKEIFSYIEKMKRSLWALESNCNGNSLLPHSSQTHHPFETSHYEKNFVEIGMIASGGFGAVVKARHKIDNNIYAVKKIAFKCKNDKEFEKIIQEARSFASLKHPNIVNYNNAWLDNCGPSFNSNASSDVSAESTQSEKSPVELKSESENSYDIQFSEDCDASHIQSIRVPYSSDSSIIHTVKSFHSHAVNISTTTSGSYSDSTSSSSKTSDTVNSESDSSAPSTTRQRLSSVLTCPSSDADDIEVLPPMRISSAGNENAEALLSSGMYHSLSLPSIKAMFYIQMEYCDYDLRTWIDGRNNEGYSIWKNLFPLNIFRQILCGIEHMHKKYVIHRDLKPKNIFIMQESGIIKIGDFGLACLVHQTSEQACLHCLCHTGSYSVGLGTVPYAAPEQIATRNYDFKVDIYSAGIILFELLYPCKTIMEFSTEVKKIIDGEFPPCVKENHVKLIKQMIKENPNERPNASQILQSSIFINKKVKKKTENLWKKVFAIDKSLQTATKMVEDLKEIILLKDGIIGSQEEKIKLLEEENELLRKSAS